MRVGFDVSQTAERMAGCGIVADQFLRHLVPACPFDEFVPYPVFGNYRHPGFVHATCPAAANVVTDQFHVSWADINSGWDRSGAALHAFLGCPDLIHANNYFCPRDAGAPVVYTVYDLSQIERPGFHTEANRLACVNGLFDASLYASHFVAISSHSRDRFLHWFPHVDRDRVSVVRLAARPSLSAPVSPERLAATLARFDLSADGFWLSVGTIEPRKNYGLLLGVYARLVADRPADVRPLCIVGQPGWIESSIEPRIRQLGLETLVQCVGFVDDDELAALYRTCFALVYPSSYEGFGLPVIEAMACGAAVVATGTTSLPEVIGNAGILVEPHSPDGLLEAMTRLVDEPNVRADVRAAAVAHASAFSWAASATALAEVYRVVANMSPATAERR